jgi:hypothetical protein
VGGKVVIAEILQTYRRRGAVAVLVAISMVTLLLFGALAVDVGYICAIIAEQQNTADASSLAGAGVLQYGDTTTTKQHVLDVIAMNQRPQGYLSLDDQIIEIGIWNSVTNTFTPSDEANWEDAFAVRVRAARNQTQLFFAAIAGITETDIWREAIAVGSGPCGGIWGLEGVRTTGNITTDSYVGSGGPYDSANPMDNGDVCSGRGIRVNGSVDINGDAMAGLGYWVDSRGQPIITGITSATLDGIEAPAIDFTDVTTSNDNDLIGLTDGGASPFTDGLNVSLNSYDNLTLAPGTYYFDSMNFNADAALTITGPTTIYLTGNFNSTGSGIVNTTGNAGDLTIISAGTDIKINGDFDFYGQILAPNAEVRMGGSAEAYGAVIAKTVELFGDFTFHVDESVPFAKPWYDVPPPMLVK